MFNILYLKVAIFVIMYMNPVAILISFKTVEELQELF